MSRVAQNTISLFAVRILSSVFSFLVVIFIARSTNTEFLGEFSLVFAYFILFTEFPLLGLNIYLSRELAKKNEHLDSFFFIGNVLSFASVILLLGVLVALIHWGHYPMAVSAALFWIAFALFPSGIIAVSQTIFLGFEKIDQFSYLTVFENLCRSVCAFFVLLHKGSLADIFYLFFVFRMLSMLLNIILLSRGRMVPLSFSWDNGLFISALKNWPVFLIINVLALISSKISLLLLSKLGTIQDVGLYSAAYKFLDVLLMAPTAFAYALLPYLSKHVSLSEVSKKVSLFLKIFSMVAMVAVSFFFIGAKQIIVTVYGASFVSSAAVLSILIWSFLITGCDQIMVILLLSQNKQMADLKMLAIFFVAYLCSLFVLIPRFHYIGAAVATVLSTGFLFMLRIIYFRKSELKVRFDGFGRGLLYSLALFFGVCLICQLAAYPPYLSWVLFLVFYFAGIFFLGIFSKDEKEIVLNFLKMKTTG